MSRDLDLDTVVLVTALVLLVGALAVATVPGLGVLVPSPLRGFGEVFGASLVSWLVAAALALSALVGLGLLKGRHRSVAETEASEAADGDGGGEADGGGTDAAEERDGGDGSPGAEAVVGGTLTEEYLQRRDELRARSSPPDPGPTDGLQNAAVAVQLAHGHDAETAHERVRSGAWTDNPVAAAFLGDETAGSLSFWRRLYAVVYPSRAFERRFERTLAELEAAAERTPGTDPRLHDAGGTADGAGGTAGADGEIDGETGDEEDDASGQRDDPVDGNDRTEAERIPGGT